MTACASTELNALSAELNARDCPASYSSHFNVCCPPESGTGEVPEPVWMRWCGEENMLLPGIESWPFSLPQDPQVSG